MILREGRIGDARRVFVHDPTLRARVDLGQPVTTAKALLRGFDVAFAGGDRELARLQVQLELGFGDRPGEVEVIARLDLADRAPTGELVQVEVLYTLVAT